MHPKVDRYYNLISISFLDLGKIMGLKIRDFLDGKCECKKGTEQTRHWWLTPVILATHEAEIRRITVRSQLEQIVHKTLS
jgi:hypothetical protein